MRRRALFIVGGTVLFTCVCATYLYMSPKSLRKVQGILPNRENLARLVQEQSSRRESRPFRGLIESGRLEKMCYDVNKTIVSETIPPFYPYEGIGSPAVIPENEFGTEHFRGFCRGNLSAIVIAYSAAQNFDRRRAIRDTIGRQCETYRCRVVFIVGVSKHKEIAERVKSEYWQKLDMFMKNKIDTYVDLNNKAVAMLDWLLEFCQEPKYIIHLIDDAFVNVRLYLKGLTDIKDTDRYFYGKIFDHQGPHRNIKSIYYVSPKVYPSPRYPDFVVGISYAFPNSLTRELRCAVHKAKYVWLEDVWLLGHIKEYLGLRLIQSTFESWHIGFETLDLQNVRNLLYLHNTGVEDFYRFYKVLNTTA